MWDQCTAVSTLENLSEDYIASFSILITVFALLSSLFLMKYCENISLKLLHLQKII